MTNAPRLDGAGPSLAALTKATTMNHSQQHPALAANQHTRELLGRAARTLAGRIGKRERGIESGLSGDKKDGVIFFRFMGVNLVARPTSVEIPGLGLHSEYAFRDPFGDYKYESDRYPRAAVVRLDADGMLRDCDGAPLWPIDLGAMPALLTRHLTFQAVTSWRARLDRL